MAQLLDWSPAWASPSAPCSSPMPPKGMMTCSWKWTTERSPEA